MKLSNQGSVPVYTIAGASTARPLPEWLARKRKRSLKRDPEFANRIELLQDFEFEEASSCVRVSEDGDWALSTGTYKPQMHAHYLPHLSLSYARHTNALNETFILLSSDYSKSLHLQTDRFLEFHTPGGCHYTTRIPRYGRHLKYSKRNTEALIPAVGLDADGNGEVFRLNLELGRFMKSYDIDLGANDDMQIDGLQGGVNAEAVTAAAVAEQSHNLLAFGTSHGAVEFWDDRSRSRVGTLKVPRDHLVDEQEGLTVLEFKRSGLQIALGTSAGRIHLYDLRSPVPLLKKEQGYDFPIQNITFLESELSPDKVMSADKRIIKIWDAHTGDPWTSVEPAVDLNHVEYIPKTGMFLTANEGRQQHAFLIPQLGAAPKWCAFLDNLVEEMAEDAEDPSAYDGGRSLNTAGAVYDNYKFLSTQQLAELNLEHLIGQTSLLRPYMHGYFVAQKLYEQARLISNPDLFVQQRQQTIQDRIAKERESRVRGTKQAAKVKVNRKLAEQLLEKEEANERRKARRVLRQGGDDDGPKPDDTTHEAAGEEDVNDVAADTVAPTEPRNDGSDAPPPTTTKGRRATALQDSRFKSLFADTAFEIDETSREYALANPATEISTPGNGVPASGASGGKRLTAAEEEEFESHRRRADTSSEEDDDDDDDVDDDGEVSSARTAQKSTDRSTTARVSSSSYKKAGHNKGPQMVASSSISNHPTKSYRNNDGDQGKKQRRSTQHQHQQPSFGSLAKNLSNDPRGNRGGNRGVVGEKSVTFAPSASSSGRGAAGSSARGNRNGAAAEQRSSRDGGETSSASNMGRDKPRGRQDRRSASGNVFRRM